jgi:hypothetical protein
MLKEEKKEKEMQEEKKMMIEEVRDKKKRKEEEEKERSHAKKTPGLMLDRVEKEAASNSFMFVFLNVFLVFLLLVLFSTHTPFADRFVSVKQSRDGMKRQGKKNGKGKRKSNAMRILQIIFQFRPSL